MDLLLISPEHIVASTWRVDLAEIVQDGLTPIRLLTGLLMWLPILVLIQ